MFKRVFGRFRVSPAFVRFNLASAWNLDFDEQQQYLDSVDYRRQDLEEACGLLAVPWRGDEDTIFRMPEMSLSQQLTFWQLVSIHFVAGEYSFLLCFKGLQ